MLYCTTLEKNLLEGIVQFQVVNAALETNLKLIRFLIHFRFFHLKLLRFNMFPFLLSETNTFSEIYSVLILHG